MTGVTAWAVATEAPSEPGEGDRNKDAPRKQAPETIPVSGA